MDREILFRAKRKENGEWVQGYLWEGNDSSYIIPRSLRIDYYEKEKRIMAFASEVDPETICQYTGLTDKNGNKIFERDIVNVSFKEARIGAKKEIYPYAVEFCRSTASFEFVGNDELLGRPCFEVGNQFIMDVIGNIFDNPELLGAGSNSGQ